EYGIIVRSLEKSPGVAEPDTGPASRQRAIIGATKRRTDQPISARRGTAAFAKRLWHSFVPIAVRRLGALHCRSHVVWCSYGDDCGTADGRTGDSGPWCVDPI